MMIPPYLTQLLSDTAELTTHDGPSRLECRVMGSLELPTGRIVACDPLLGADDLTLGRTVPPGAYPVGVSDITLPDGDERIAAAWLRFGATTPVRWEPATWSTRPKAKNPAYAVDSGMGAFYSAEASTALASALDSGFDDQVYAALESGGTDTALLPVPGVDGLNVAIFSTGDGIYGSYWGFDAAGEVTCLITDFDVLGLPDADPAASSAERKPWWKVW